MGSLLQALPGGELHVREAEMQEFPHAFPCWQIYRVAYNTASHHPTGCKCESEERRYNDGNVAAVMQSWHQLQLWAPIVCVCV